MLDKPHLSRIANASRLTRRTSDAQGFAPSSLPSPASYRRLLERAARRVARGWRVIGAHLASEGRRLP